MTDAYADLDEIESQFDLLRTEHYDYMVGRCGAFAVALHRHTGFAIFGFRYRNGGRWDLAHAFVDWPSQDDDDDLGLDISGIRSVSEIYEAYYHASDDGADIELVHLTPLQCLRLQYGSAYDRAMAEEDIVEAMPIAARVVELARQYSALLNQEQ